MQLTIAEAARHLGLPEKTVRRQVRNGELPGTQLDTPQGYRWIVELPDGEPATEVSTGETAAIPVLVDVLKDEVAQLREQLQAQAAAHQEQLGAKDKQIEQLHVLLQHTQAALPAPREDRPWWRRWWR